MNERILYRRRVVLDCKSDFFLRGVARTTRQGDFLAQTSISREPAPQREALDQDKPPAAGRRRPPGKSAAKGNANDFLAAALGRSRTQVQALLKRELVHLQPVSAKAQASYRLKSGDTVTIEAEPAAPIQAEPSGEAMLFQRLSPLNTSA